MFAQAQGLELVTRTQAIEIPVADPQALGDIGLNQGVGRALDPTVVAQSTQQTAHQTGLAGAEVSGQADQSGADHTGQLSPQLQCGRFVHQMQAQILAHAGLAMVRR